MPLFDTSEDLFGYTKKTGTTKVPSENELLKVSGKYMLMKDAIGDLSDGKTIFFVTAGSWAMHDLLHYVLNITGPAEVKCFTWAVSIPGAQEIIKMISSGLITKCDFMAHYLMRKMCAEAMAMLQNHCHKCVGACNHSKGFILKNDRWRVSCIASANYSNNPTIEGGALTTNPDVYAMNEKWLNPIFENEDDFIGKNMISDYTPPEEKHTDTESKILYLVRGLPGSGKSTLALSIADEVYENDDFFTRGNGIYTFDPAHLPAAITTCYSNVKNAMERGVKRIAVANVFANSATMEEYYKLAALFHYRIFSIITENRGEHSNVHGVPAAQIQKMKSNFQVKLC